MSSIKRAAGLYHGVRDARLRVARAVDTGIVALIASRCRHKPTKFIAPSRSTALTSGRRSFRVRDAGAAGLLIWYIGRNLTLLWEPEAVDSGRCRARCCAGCHGSPERCRCSAQPSACSRRRGRCGRSRFRPGSTPRRLSCWAIEAAKVAHRLPAGCCRSPRHSQCVRAGDPRLHLHPRLSQAMGIGRPDRKFFGLRVRMRSTC